ncbi:MAG TPA: nucleotidyltransferase family protein [Longimicrobiales bacterium]
MMIDGVVLAAGASTRMGESKAQLQIEGTTFIERAIHLLRAAGCRYVVAVVADDDWTIRLADVSGAEPVINADRNSAQIDSLRLGIANLPEDSEAVVVLPVDFPRIEVDTVKQLIGEFARSGARIANPVRNGTTGPPVIFARSVWPELMQGDLPDGARSVMAAHQDETHTTDVTDDGVLIDIDTPSDYAQHVKKP